ncbi:MAG: septum site-determining protein MinC [Anaerolineae bacterium]|nr:septum site-determining protein MinC [Anaerolineae bacterium]
MISIKGQRQGILILFSDAEGATWAAQLDELKAKLEQSGSFFSKARMSLDVKTLSLSLEELQAAKNLLEEHRATLWAIASQNDKTIANTRRMGLATDPNKEDPPALVNDVVAKENPFAAIADGTDGLLVQRIVRSGQTLRHPGHIVVIGDVNPGAELIAGSDIIVWGKLYGAAHAGSTGNDKAVVCALDLRPTILRIANMTRRVPEDKKRKHPKPEMAKIVRQEMNIYEWTP